MHFPELRYQTALQLRHNGTCHILGVSPDLTVYAEEIYADEPWMAQHALRIDGTFISSIDEDHGTNTAVTPIPLPPDALRPQTGWHSSHLNYRGPRHRGLREPERVDSVVRNLSISARMQLIKWLGLDIPPPMVIGLAESFVLSEVELVRPNLYLVCRRVRLAYALAEPATDEDGQPYDYDTRVLHFAHFYDRDAMIHEAPIETLIAGLPGVELRQPMDCARSGDHIFVADAGNEDNLSAIHVWRIHAEQAQPDETARP